MMTSREIVRRCIEFRDPPRIGLHFHVDPIEGRVWEETDFAGVQYATDSRFSRQEGETEWMTEWGVRRSTLASGIGEAVGFPLGAGWHLFDEYTFPDFEASWRWEGLEAAVGMHRAKGKYVYGVIPSLMLLPIDLRGMENWFLDHAMEQENLARLLARIMEARAVLIERYAAAGVDAVITYDDMGTQSSGLVSPQSFRDLYFQPYKQTIDLLHEHGMHFIHHCCGHVKEYMDMFVEAGCDVLQLDQPELMGIDWLGEHYGGKLCFWNCVDIQKTIHSENLADIEEDAHRQVWQLGNYGGGFMVKAYQQPGSAGITAAASETQYRAFKKYGNYPLVPYL